jgi:hypothetical protein
MAHPFSEGQEYAFDTAGGRVRVERSRRNLMPLGELEVFASVPSSLGVIEKLVNTCPIKRSSPNTTPLRNIIVGSIRASIAEGKRFQHVRYVQHDGVIGKILGVEHRIPGDDAI